MKFGHEAIANLPRPNSWNERPLTDAAKQSIDLVTREKSFFDPLHLDSMDAMMDSMTPRLTNIYLSSIGGRPKSIKEFLEYRFNVWAPIIDPVQRPPILKYLLWLKAYFKDGGEGQARIYADQDEQQIMEVCHPRCITILEGFIRSIDDLDDARALDVAAGDGRLTSSLLRRFFKEVDLFDQCKEANRKAMNAFQRDDRIRYIEHTTMQSYWWPSSFTAVFMVWCVGYLERHELVEFLKRAKIHLQHGEQGEGQMRRGPTRHTPPRSFVFVLDNVRPADQTLFRLKGQWVRSQQELEEIWVEAGLLTYKKEGPLQMPADQLDVVVWALY